MENININRVENNSENTNEQAINISKKLLEIKNDFISKISSLIENDENLKNALRKYTGSSNAQYLLDGFELYFSGGTLNYTDLDFEKNILANPEKTASLENINSVENELNNRIESITNMISDFSGNEDEAYELIELIHKREILPKLNTEETPILV